MGEINGAAVQPVDNNEVYMKLYKSFTELLENIDDLPKVGWIFVESTIDRASEKDVDSATFYVADNDAESIALEKEKRAFLECPTFVDVKSILDKRPVKPSNLEYLRAAIYYLEHDDFQD
ncbi:hypothetical protein ALO66_200045 [Pseudomonas coronafaciens pv. atropurpurea]|nr:hypothetical protein ALO66_200045 [Pseudomonas coronafaciens pv. atropurpurea]